MKRLRFDGMIREPRTTEEALNDLRIAFRQLLDEILLSLTGRKSS